MQQQVDQSVNVKFEKGHDIVKKLIFLKNSLKLGFNEKNELSDNNINPKTYANTYIFCIRLKKMVTVTITMSLRAICRF